MAAKCVILGPQRLAPTVREAVEELGVEGPIAAITAGWEERESEDDELHQHLAGRTFNLELFRRAEDVFERDPELFAGMRERRDQLGRLQELYRLRLKHALRAARALLRLNRGEDELLAEECRAAVETVRELDAHHLERAHEVNLEFYDDWRPGQRDSVVRHRAEIERQLDGVGAVCVAGGHVQILLNRLRLFDLGPLLAGRTVLAWSAGAMALSERIVLFHDRPPQGRGDAEVLEPGLCVFPQVVPLPHARRRLRLADAARVGLFARRFGPSLCVALDESTGLRWDGARWAGRPGTRRLMETGELAEVPA